MNTSLPTRRSVLRAAGITLALPLLEYFQPRLGFGATPAPIRRMVSICTPLSVYSGAFFPQQAGHDYTLSPYLEPIADLRDDFTVISGLPPPDVGNSHDSANSFLTAAPHPENRGGFRNSISLDQFAAEQIGGKTRFPTLSLSAEGLGLSWTRSGA